MGNSNQSNSSTLFWALSILGLVIWAFCFFAGFNYTNNGAWIASMSLALFLLVVTMALVFVMCNTAKKNDHKSKTLNMLAIGLYAVAIVASVIYVAHFLDVSINRQNDIQDEALAEINEVYDYIDCEDSPNPRSYMAWVDQELDSYARHLRAQDLSESTIETRVSELRSQLVDESGFSEMVSEAEDFLEHCHYSVNNWVWVTVPKYLGQLSEKKPQYEKRLQQYALSTEFTREDSEQYVCASKHNDPSMVEQVSNASLASFSIVSIVLILVLQAMILLVYFRSRPSKNANPVKFKNAWAGNYDPRRNNAANPEYNNNFPEQRSKQPVESQYSNNNNENTMLG